MLEIADMATRGQRSEYDDGTAPAGSRMSYWIATTLHDEREKAGISEDDMARTIGVNWRTIRRLESGQGMGRDIDRFVAGYAYLLGVEDGRELWEAAQARWRRDGSPPRFEAIDGPAAAFAEAIRLEALRRREDPHRRAGDSGPRAKRRASQ